MITADGKNLFFVISLPRSGSTLTQRVIGEAPNIHTFSESWLLLQYLYDRKLNRNIYAEYNHALLQRAQQETRSAIPDGNTKLDKSIAKAMVEYLNEHLRHNNASKLLEKTPRYYLILEDILELFPEAKVILLVRNPLAILTSILDGWASGDVGRLREYKVDLVKGLRLMASHAQIKNDNLLRVSYEDLVTEPDQVFRQIFHHFRTRYSTSFLNYSTHAKPWQFGDQVTVGLHNNPSSDRLTHWKTRLSKPGINRLAMEYVREYSAEFDQLGYPAEEQIELIRSVRTNEEDPETQSLNSLFKDLSDTPELGVRIQKYEAAIRAKDDRAEVLRRHLNSLIESNVSAKSKTERIVSDLTETLEKTTRLLTQANAKLAAKQNPTRTQRKVPLTQPVRYSSTREGRAARNGRGNRNKTKVTKGVGNK